MPPRRRPLRVSETGARSTKNTPWSKSARWRWPNSIAARVLPTPPVPVSVTTLPSRNCSAIVVQQALAADERRRDARQVRAVPEDTAWLGEVVLQIGMVHLEERYSTDVAEPMRAERTNLHAIGQKLAPYRGQLR